MKHIICLLTFFSLLSFSEISAQDNLKVITQVVDAYPMLSLDNANIVFTSNRTGTYQIYICKPDGSDIIQLTHSEGGNVTPVWSPDGRQIVFASDRDNDSEIYIMSADGTEQKRLTNQPGDDSHPKFSPDGKKIIFNSARTTPDLTAPWLSHFIEIFTMDINGDNVKQITSFESISTYPSFSPDGRKIVFRMITNDPGMNWSLEPIKINSEVFVMNSDGSIPVNISNSKAFDGWPCWMPGNQTILFTSNRGGVENKGQLYSVKLDGTNLTRLTDINDSFIQASVSKGSNKIFAQRNWETDTYEYGHIVAIDIK
jgi:Tol biopolymer transport system component